MLVSFPPRIPDLKSIVAITQTNKHQSNEKCVNEKTRDCKMFLDKKTIARTTTITTVTASTATTTTAYGFQHCTTTKQNNNDNNKTEIQLPDLFSMVPILRRHPP